MKIYLIFRPILPERFDIVIFFNTLGIKNDITIERIISKVSVTKMHKTNNTG